MAKIPTIPANEPLTNFTFHHGLGLNEYRFLMIIMQIACETKIGLSNDKKDWFILRADLMQSILGHKTPLYQVIHDVSDTMRQKTVVWHTTDKLGNKINHEIPWFSHLAYQEGQGYTQVRFNPQIAPFVRRLNEKFLSDGYTLENTKAFTSKYEYFLYTFFMLNRNRGVVPKFELQTLRSALDLDDVTYKTTPNLLKCLLFALDNLREHSRIDASFKTVKHGRRITHVIFDFEKKMKWTSKPLLENQPYYSNPFSPY